MNILKKKLVKKLAVCALLCTSILGTSAVAFADAAMDFEVTSAKYDENGKLQAIGLFKNTGDTNIETVTKVHVKLTLGNDSGDSVNLGEQYFENIEVHLAPEESAEVTLEFTDVPYYEDATTYSAEEDEWEFTYFE